MATADQIYQFRRTEAGMTFENITKFREAFKEHHHRPVTAKQVLEALADKPDVRNFSNSGQAKNPYMLSSACEENRLTTRVSELLGITGEPDPFILALIPPLNDNELYGYRRPNVYFSQTFGSQPSEQADMSACTEADSAISTTFQQLNLSPLSYTKKPNGNVCQYIRSIVLQHYHHAPLSEEAWKHWLGNTSLANPEGTPDPTQVKKGKEMVPMDEVHHDIMIAVLHHIHDFFSVSGFSWLTFIRYLTEPMPNDIRDHFKAVVCTSLLVALDLEENKDLLKKVALRLRAACFLDACFPGVTLVPFVPAMYRSQSEVLKTLDWQNENGKVLYWQVSARVTNIRPTGGDFTDAIESWKRKEQLLRYPPLMSGPFNTVDLAMCDRYWLDGYPAALMEERMSLVLGRDLRYIRTALGALAERWTYNSDGTRVVVENAKD